MIAHAKSSIDRREFGHVTGNVLASFLVNSRSRRRRTITEFAEEEIVLTTGPRKDRRFRVDTQPWNRLWFTEWESGYWYEFCSTGPSQSGKSLICYVIPILYGLFELQIDVIAACTTMEMAHDKWSRDLLPVIENTRYRELVPKIGAGSRGGFNGLTTFLHGNSLKWMSAGGGDKTRAYYTASMLAITECDGFSSLETSDEAHPIDQIEARLRAESRRRRIVLKECTVTYDDGYIWKSIHKRGSASKIVLKCPHCGVWDTPERKDLVGWQQATNEIEIEDHTLFHCPGCGEAWTELERREANRKSKLIHNGQKIYKNGRIVGKRPPTRTLGFRYSAVNNLLLPASDLGVDEWEASRSDDEINAEKKLCQFVWAIPFQMPGLDLTKLDREAVEKRRLQYPKGVVPPSTKWITVGIDVGKYRCDWVAFAWMMPERIGLVIDYGEVELKQLVNARKLDANDLGFQRVFHDGMKTFFFGNEGQLGLFDGWPIAGEESYKKPDVAWIDCRYQGDDPDDKVIFNCLKSWHEKRILPIMGHGEKQFLGGKYRVPTIKSKLIVFRGHYYDIRYEPEIGLHVGHVDVDAWKAIVQTRISKAENEPGSLMLYDSISPTEHQKFVKELDAESRERVFEPGKGIVEQWIVHRERNHKLDASVYGCAGGHFKGFRTNPHNDPKPAKSPKHRQGLRMGKRPFLVTQR